MGDVRRNRRLVGIVEDLAGSPESSVPLASRDRAALQGMYDFWANPRIKASLILAAHRDRLCVNRIFLNSCLGGSNG
ncbi:MAG TPA: transposase DNA-binding-containing protein [Candidatus Sericytochromatia bacterium]